VQQKQIIVNKGSQLTQEDSLKSEKTTLVKSVDQQFYESNT